MKEIDINYKREYELMKKRHAELENENKIKHIDSQTLAEIKSRLKEMQFIYEKDKKEKRLEELKKKKEYIEDEITALTLDIYYHERKHWEGE